MHKSLLLQPPQAPLPSPNPIVWSQLPTDRRQQGHELMAQLLIHVSHSAPERGV